MLKEVEIKTEYILEADVKIKSFGIGEWVSEPDYAEFQFMGIDCKVVRIFAKETDPSLPLFGGHLCGYCKLPHGHPDEKDDESETYNYPDYDVHGGITYLYKESDGYTWIGFDCAHFDDCIPSIDEMRRNGILKSVPYSSYKNLEWVIDETKRLAEMVKDKEIRHLCIC